MKRIQLIKHLEASGCELIREGANHSWWWNSQKNLRSSVPRHTEINDILAQKICKDLGIEKVKS